MMTIRFFTKFVLLVAAINFSASPLLAQSDSAEYKNFTDRLEARGDVASSTDDEKANIVPMTVEARFAYEELIQNTRGIMRSVRFYEKATAEIKLGKQSETSKLDESNRFVLLNRSVKKGADKKVAMASLSGQLDQRQWQLIEVPANTMFLHGLIADQKLEKNHSWKVKDSLLADCVLLETISSNDVKCKVTSVDRSSATISIKGSIRGIDDDTNCEIELSGKIRCSLEHKIEQVEWTLKQQRDEGQVAPGLKATIKMLVNIESLSSPRALTTKSIARARGKRKISSDLVAESPARNFRFIHDRQWRVVLNASELTVMRLVDEGQVMGQCNLIPMPRIPSPQAYSIEEFKKNVAKAIGKDAQIVNSTARKVGGNTIYEVEASGDQDGVDLTWLYFHVAQPNGERAMFILTTETDLIDTVRGTEQKMIRSLLIRDESQAKKIREREAAMQKSNTRRR